MFAEFATAAGGQGRAPAISHRPSCAVSGLAAGGRGVTQRTFATFFVKLRQGSGKDRQGKGLKASTLA